jgi:hypothetical protein
MGKELILQYGGQNDERTTAQPKLKAEGCKTGNSDQQALSFHI